MEALIMKVQLFEAWWKTSATVVIIVTINAKM